MDSQRRYSPSFHHLSYSMAGFDGSVTSCTSSDTVSSFKVHRKKGCTYKHVRQDEPHWSKVLQAKKVSVESAHSIASLVSPPSSPLFTVGQTLTKLFKCMTLSKRHDKRCNSAGDTDRSTSLSSDDSTHCCASPLADSPIQIKQNSLHAADLAPVLKEPASSSLLIRREQEKRQYNNHLLPSSSTIQKNKTLLSEVKTNMKQRKATKESAVGLTTMSTLPGHSPLSLTHSCPSSKTNLESLSNKKEWLSSTWPSRSRCLSFSGDKHADDTLVNFERRNYEKNIQEFMIPFESVIMDKSVGFWRHGQVYKGRWHGPVLIQTYEGGDPCVKEVFDEEIRRLSRIRHDNIALFLGACTERTHLVLVISLCPGISMHDKLTAQREVLPLALRMNLAYQVSQALAYLHAKNIIYRILNSHNLFIDKRKVTLSSIDFTAVKNGKRQDNKFCNKISYLAPELLRYFVANPGLEEGDFSLPYTKQTDIYALGIVIYELLVAKIIYKELPKDIVVKQVCNGRRPCMDELSVPTSLKNTLKLCLSESSVSRLHTHEIVNKLLRKDITLHNRFTSSEPENLCKALHHSIC